MLTFILTRCCRPLTARWLNQLRPNVQTGGFLPEEDELIIKSQAELGNRWTTIAALSAANCDVVKKVGGPGGLLRGSSETAVRRSLSGLDRFPLRLSLLRTVVTVAILLAV